MSWRLKVSHHTGLRYTEPVSASFNEARMTPADGGGQLLIAHELRVSPSARVQAYTDYWGTTVEAFDLHEPHTVLDVTSNSVVETTETTPLETNVDWADLAEPAVVDAWCEFLRPSRYVDDARDDPHRSDLLAELAAYDRPADAIHAAVTAVEEHMRYTPGSTNVFTKASEAWANGVGVCQDFTHVTLSLLRPLGIPARYVSGYLYTGSGEVGERVTGESHAWVEVWDGDWHGLDPTNGRVVGEGHVIVARGRDYADVSPLKGIYAGGHSESLGVEVSLTRLPR
ncbi:MAG: transglutaminase family protein [Actinobacteria bacterium]|nr:transglutaminase family protein [Actinomycetota bacterium]MCB9411441.1 transglutaminase family protein [Actinomycetota bacterium]